jgi:hypothetical protein
MMSFCFKARGMQFHQQPDFPAPGDREICHGGDHGAADTFYYRSVLVASLKNSRS